MEQLLFGGEKMKRIILSSIILVILVLSTSTALSSGPIQIKPPILATAVGDGEGSVILNLVCGWKGIECESVLDLIPARLEERLSGIGGPGTLVVATGAIVEGDLYTICNIEKMSIEKESSRIEGLIAVAKSSRIPVIGLHIDRGITSPDTDPGKSLDLIMPYADAIILVTHIGMDEYFEEIAAAGAIPLIVIDNSDKLVEALEALFSMNLGECE